MIIGILCLSMFSVIAPRARALASETPLQVAEKAATWTISQAIYENGGYKWTDYMQAPYFDASVQYGSAGYGTLYLELYEKTGNSMYLDYAKGAAQWIISQAVPDSGGYKWPHHDDSIPSPGWWLSPAVSGIGEFLLQMYKTTGNTTYLDYATGAAQWLMAMAYWGEPGCFIPYNPPNPYGTQASHGIDPAREAYTVTFLLHLYEETGNSTYLEYVTGTAEWLISGPDKVVNPSGYEWRFNRPYYSDFPLDGEGRISLFFYEIYGALGNATYLEYAQGAMNWLLSQAVVNGDTAKWFDPVLGCYRTLPFSGSYMGGIAGFWGVPEPNELLMAVYGITNNATYLDYATKLANWITSPAMAIPEGGGYKFPDAEGSSTYSAYQNAKIYNFLSWLYNVTGVTSYSEYADGALQWTIFNATETNGGYEWKTLSYFPYYATWFEPGAAGIGYYLVSAGAQAFARAWKDDSSLGLENDRLYLHGLSETGNYRWFFDYLIFKDTGTKWYQPWGELAMLVYPNFQWKTVSTTDFEVNAFTETDKAYLQYSMTSGNLKEELTYTIYPGEPYVYLTLSVMNVGSGTENTYAGIQFTTWIAGDHANDYFYVPGHGQGQFSGIGNVNFPDATETWIAEWDQNKGEGCGMLSTKSFTPSNMITEDFGIGEGFKFISDNFDLAPGQTSATYDCYFYFFTGTGWQKTADLARALTVGAPPVANFTWSPPVPVVGNVVTFNGSSSTLNGGMIVSYAWNFGDGGTGAGETATHAYSATGNCTVTLNVTDSEGLWGIQQQQILVVPLPLSVSISPLSVSITLGQSVPFTSTVNGGLIPYSYQWYLDGNSVLGATAGTWSYTPSTNGIHYVYLRVTDVSNVTTQSETARIMFKPVPIGGYSVSFSQHTLAKPLAFNFGLVVGLTLLLVTMKRKKTKR